VGYRVFGEGEAPVATVQVAWDGDESRPLPDDWRDAVETFEPSLG
jgi:hypothetical protein